MQPHTTVIVVSPKNTIEDNCLHDDMEGSNIRLLRCWHFLDMLEDSNKAAESSVKSICFWCVHDLEGDDFKGLGVSVERGGDAIKVKSIRHKTIFALLIWSWMSVLDVLPRLPSPLVLLLHSVFGSSSRIVLCLLVNDI